MYTGAMHSTQAAEQSRASLLEQLAKQQAHAEASRPSPGGALAGNEKLDRGVPECVIGRLLEIETIAAQTRDIHLRVLSGLCGLFGDETEQVRVDPPAPVNVDAILERIRKIVHESNALSLEIRHRISG